MRIEFHAEKAEEASISAIDVANALIMHRTELPKELNMGSAYATFGVHQLEEIAEYLLIHCKHRKIEDALEGIPTNI